jgi:hypothetical protein
MQLIKYNRDDFLKLNLKEGDRISVITKFNPDLTIIGVLYDTNGDNNRICLEDGDEVVRIYFINDILEYKVYS